MGVGVGNGPCDSRPLVPISFPRTHMVYLLTMANTDLQAMVSSSGKNVL